MNDSNKRNDASSATTMATDSKPLPGTPEFDEFIDRQGQEAMDAAWANPFIRVFMVPTTVFLATFAVFHAGSLFDGLWRRPSFPTADASMALLCFYVTVESASIVVRGRTVLPVYRILVDKIRSQFDRGKKVKPSPLCLCVSVVFLAL